MPWTIVIAESKEIASKAIKLIKVEVEKLEVISDPLRAIEKDVPLIHQDSNILATHYLEKGDIKKGFAQADVIVENEYKTTFIDQLPLEVEAGVGFYDEESKVIKLWAATQWLHDTQADIAQSLGLPKER